jgi:hypothetical protein
MPSVYAAECVTARVDSCPFTRGDELKGIFGDWNVIVMTSCETDRSSTVDGCDVLTWCTPGVALLGGGGSDHGFLGFGLIATEVLLFGETAYRE